MASDDRRHGERRLERHVAEPNTARSPGRLDRAVLALVRAATCAKPRAWIVLALLALASAMSIWVATGIRINADLKALLPPAAPSLLASKELSARKGHTEQVLIAIESRDAVANLAAARALLPELAKVEGLEDLTLQRDLTPLRDHALYYLEVEDLESLRDDLARERQLAVARSLSKSVGSGDGDVDLDEVLVGEDWDADPSEEGTVPAPPGLDEAPPAGLDPADGASAGHPSPVPGSSPPSNAKPVPSAKADGEETGGLADLRNWLDSQKETFVQDGRLSKAEVDALWPVENEAGELLLAPTVGRPLATEDGTVVLIQGRAARPPSDIDSTRRLGVAVREAIARLDSDLHPEGMRIELVGAYDLSRDVDTLMVDLQRATIVSALLVLTVLLVGFRRPRALIIIMLPVVFSICLTLAFATLIFGELNSLTSFLFAVLFGMGVDYGVHLLAHREQSATPQDASTWPAVAASLARPLTAAMATTAVSLSLLVFADFKAFREFGVLAAIGIVISWLVAIMAVPALDVLLPRIGALRSPRAPAADNALSEQLEAAEGTSGSAVEGREPPPVTMKRWVIATPTWRLILIAGALLVGAVYAPRVALERNLDTIRPPKPSKQIRYGSALGGDRDAVPVVLFSDDAESLAQGVARLRALMPDKDADARIRDSAWIKSVVTADQLVPATTSQHTALLAEIAELSGSFLAELPDLPEDDSAREYRTHLEALERLASAAPMRVEDLPAWARDAFTEKNGRNDRMAQVSLRYNKSDLDAMIASFERLDTELAGLDIYVVSSSRVYVDLMQSLRRDLVVLPPLALLAVVLMIALDLRSVAGTLLAAGSLVAGLVFGFGLLGILGTNINFYNMAIVPGVLGLGIDASIHLFHARYPPCAAQHEGQSHQGSANAAMKGTAFSALTTVGAFAGLLAAAHPGLASIGTLGVVVTATCVALAILAFALPDRPSRTGARSVPPSPNG